MLILNQIKKLNGERSTNSILHILNGKRSSQTIIDIQLYDLSSYFGLYEKLTRNDFEQMVQLMTTNHWITNDKNAVLTLEGEQALTNFNINQRIPSTLNGWQYHHLEANVFNRFMLLTQVLSNISYNNKNYIPIVKDKWLQLQIKQLLVHVEKKQFSKQFYEQLTKCCMEISKVIDPSFIVIHLSGYEKSGKTFLQAAQMFNMELDEYIINFKGALHAFLHEIIHHKMDYPILYDLIAIDEISPITKSTLQTEQLLNEGYSLEDISKLRSLKLSTVEDHLVELAMFRENFSIENYVSNDLKKKIVNASANLQTKKLKRIKEEVQEASYIQIRLSLAEGAKK